jgi:hypothetical protein
LLRLRRSEPALGARASGEDAGTDLATSEGAAGQGEHSGPETADRKPAGEDAASKEEAAAAEKRALELRQADARAFGDDAVLVRRSNPTKGAGGRGDILLVVQLRGKGTVELGRAPMTALRAGLAWRLLFSTEGSQYTDEPRPIRVGGESEFPRIIFLRAGAVLLKATRVLYILESRRTLGPIEVSAIRQDGKAVIKIPVVNNCIEGYAFWSSHDEQDFSPSVYWKIILE